MICFFRSEKWETPLCILGKSEDILPREGGLMSEKQQAKIEADGSVKIIVAHQDPKFSN